MTNISDGRWVFDSNLLIYFQDQRSVFHKDAVFLFSHISHGKIDPVVCQQNILEVENALLRTYKKKPLEVVDYMAEILDEFGFSVLSPLSTTYLTCQKLVLSAKRKIDLFDYYLAATMLDNGISRILTVNTKDFAGIKGIEAVNPFKQKEKEFFALRKLKIETKAGRQGELNEALHG